MWAIIRPVQAVTERQLYSDSEATVQCELFLTAPYTNILIYLLTYLLTYLLVSLWLMNGRRAHPSRWAHPTTVIKRP